MSFVRWSGDEAADDRTSIGMVLSSEDAGQCDECMIDTGAGVHVCTNWSAFTSLQEDTMSFVGWRGETSRSEAFGDVKVCATDAMSGSDVILDLVDTRYASNGVSNLLSLEQLELDGWVPFYTKAVKPADRKMHLDRGSVRLLLHKRSGHYWLKVRRTAADVHDGRGRPTICCDEVAYELCTSKRSGTEAVGSQGHGDGAGRPQGVRLR
ncbi:hypothetical protein JG687_00018472 [Phytophthora cactorum]|uniref:Retrovirus-related Pol polyprotein from transposon TNT 1-94-like beta-barrel domain-containing protein n=1 Tax=Phytophthora cactorum TaxID=29920 RepID=A0A8T1TPF2_9STRA|nr:hypothetical protein JG687_00018472 [Phytophthora cactorum]